MTNILNDHSSTDEAATEVGTLLAPLFMWHGQAVYPVFGAEGEDDGTGEQDGEPEDETDDDAGDGTNGGDGERPVTRDEFDKLRKQLSASDKNRAAAEKKLKDIEDSKKDELTKATERAEELTKEIDRHRAENADLRLQNAFLMANTGITWHDPEDALELAQKKGYLDGVVDGDGKVDTKQLSTKLKELAKAKPHLVKKDADTTDAANGKGSSAPTGTKVGSTGQTKNTKKTEVPSRYSSLLR